MPRPSDWRRRVDARCQQRASARERPACGSVWINCYQAMDPAVPFGGYKMSGYGRESGIQQMEEYLNVKAVWIRTA